MAHGARILEASISPDGVSLITFEVTFPRIILAEFNTHRVFSRNSASSRAIPIEKMIKRVMEDPYIPTSWGKNQKGMQAGEEADAETQTRAERVWLQARTQGVARATLLLDLGIHKQLTNRLLEPFMWHTVIVTSTEWDNFYHLRNNPTAHPDIITIAAMMQELHENTKPTPIKYGDWHAPLVSEVDHAPAVELAKHVVPELWKESAIKAMQEVLFRVSVARCARVSYLTHDGKRDLKKDIELYDRLLSSGHMSPFEHVARPIEDADYGNDDLAMLVHHKYLSDPHPVPLHRETWCGNYRGWVQYRKTIPGEEDILGHRQQNEGAV